MIAFKGDVPPDTFEKAAQHVGEGFCGIGRGLAIVFKQFIADFLCKTLVFEMFKAQSFEDLGQYPQAFVLVAVGAAGAREKIRDFMQTLNRKEGEDYLFVA